MNSYLIKRHSKIFFRDLSAVFFAILSSIIVIGINLFILKDVYITLFTSFGFPENKAEVFVTAWTICGALAINSVTIPLSFIGFAVADKENEILKDFKSSSLKLSSLNLSYVISSVIITLLINTPIILGLIIYTSFKEVLVLSVLDFLFFALIYTLGATLFSLIGMFLTKFIKTRNAHSGLVGVSSAFLGFIGSIYMPLGNFSGTIKAVITSNPLTMLNMVIKDTFMNGIINDFNLPKSLLLHFGITLTLSDFEITTSFTLIILTILCVLFYVLNNTVKSKD